MICMHSSSEESREREAADEWQGTTPTPIGSAALLSETVTLCRCWVGFKQRWLTEAYSVPLVEAGEGFRIGVAGEGDET
jgi:hypothetical protein